MPNHCTECGRKGTKSGSRVINEQTKVCNECQPAAETGNEVSDDVSSIDPNSMLGELSFREFSVWFKREVHSIVDRRVAEATKKIEHELEETKKSATSAHSEIAALKTQVNTLKNSLKDIQEENVKLKKTGENNLKYLVNLDRNTRRSNVIVLGLPENENLDINTESLSSDAEKVEGLLKFIKVDNQVEIQNLERLGKVSDDDESHRPLKVQLKNSEMAFLITSNAYNLKTLDKKIFMKPDKSKKEREEFQRLLKRKTELILSHPAADGAESRVILKKGVLTVDGIVKDRYVSPQTIF